MQAFKTFSRGSYTIKVVSNACRSTRPLGVRDHIYNVRLKSTLNQKQALKLGEIGLWRSNDWARTVPGQPPNIEVR